ncbi:methylamine utilization protein MauD [Novosphingobium sp. PC22D]|uniref:redoxin family protein n=1 Tax=Novosphingobium sp. PC22D TaxID=1962403 RepID=UPI000BEFF8B7|nr:redoxin family protein [Novosphingobium sp. PC22D]PEQ12878.1 methylamine utilization protein MauD [Novosphingobium sp. PC22D]
MLTILIVSQVVSWMLVVGLAVALLAVARQVGVLHERVAPVGVLTPQQGPVAGDKAPHLVLQTLDGQVVEIGGDRPMPVKRLLFFVSAQCPICKKLIPAAKSFARAENIELIFMGDDTEAKQRSLIEQNGLQAYAFVNSAHAGRTLGVDKLPHAALIAEDGRIIARGLVNSREHLESMVMADELNVGSVQEYLRASKLVRE